MTYLRRPALIDLAEARWGTARSWRCVYCGSSAPFGEVDHFVPRRRGGTDLPWNLVPACRSCNASKADHDPIAWMHSADLPEPTISALQSITRTPTLSPTFAFTFRSTSPVYAADYDSTGSWLRDLPAVLMLPTDLSEVFVLDADAWAPTTALRRISAAHLADQGLPPLSSQQLGRELADRGLLRSKRRGVWGFRGVFVTPEAAGRLTTGRAASRASRARATRMHAAAFESSAA